MARLTPKTARDWCLGILLILVFLASLFAFVGMPIYAHYAGVSYAQAWLNLDAAIRAVISN